MHLQPPPRAHGFQNLGTSRNGLTFLCAAAAKYPFKLFGLLDPELRSSLASDIIEDHKDRPCLLDPFTSWFLKHSPPKEALQSPGALQELTAMAVQASVDIASTECQHASNRRSVEAKSNQTHRQKLKHASANFVARSLRRTCSTAGPQAGPQVVQGSKGGTKQILPSLLRPEEGCRGLVDLCTRTVPITPDKKRARAMLQRKCHSLGREEQDRLRHLASIATAARKSAREPGRVSG